MRKNLHSLLALLLAVVMVLSLSACGEKQTEEENKEQPVTENPEMVYTAESTRLDSDLFKNGINPLAFTDKGFYGTAYDPGDYPEPILTETTDADESDQSGDSAEGDAAAEPESENAEGEADAEKEQELISADYGMKLYFVSYDGSITALTEYKQLPGNPDPGDKTNFYSGSSLYTILTGRDGGLIAVECIYTGWFDGTEEEMMSDSPAAWEKYRNTQEYYLRGLNADGSEKSSVKLDFEAQDTWLNFNLCKFDKDGNLLVPGDQALYIFSADGSLQQQISTENWVENLIEMRDGSLMAVGWGDRGMSLYPLDLEKKSFGEPVKVPDNAYNLLPGSSEYDFYYVNGMYLYGYKVDTEENDKLLNFMDVDVNGSNINQLQILEDGSLYCVVNQYRNDRVTTDIIRVHQVPYDQVPHKETLTLAVMYGYSIYDTVIDFNRSNDKVRIQVVDYSEFNDIENEDYDAGRTKLLTEIMSGQMPDLIAVGQLPYSQLAAKGLLEDLYPYLDADKDLKREDFFPNALKGLEINGGLYQITSGFNVVTLAGAKSVVGDKPGWNYKQLKDALATMPEGCDPLDMYTTRGDLLRTLLCTDLEHYVDWSTGKCSFNSQDFIDMLEFTKQFPAELPDDLEWEDSETRIAEGRQMLSTVYLYSVDSMIWNDVNFGEEGSTYIGYPTNHGVGSYMSLDEGYAMTVKCRDKEAGWEFLRSFLNDDVQRNSWNGIPMSVKVYQEKLEKAMTPQYQTDAKGEYVLDENGERIPISIGGVGMADGSVREVYNMTQEQADKLWEAVSTCEKIMDNDTTIYDIVYEQAQAYYSGQKTAEEVARLIDSKVTIYINEQR